MILRSLTKHVRDQNWFAVGLDFFIVVVGVFIGIQVANWNEERQADALGSSYLARLTDDLVAMETYLEGRIEATTGHLALTAALLKSASQEKSNEGELTEATRAFFNRGWVTPSLLIIDTVFEDLSSTGNFDLLEESVWREISSYYAELDLVLDGFEISQDWALRNDSRLTHEHDIYLWDDAFHPILGPPAEERLRRSIGSAKVDLARLASTYYYLQESSIRTYQSKLEQTRQLIDRLRSMQSIRP